MTIPTAILDGNEAAASVAYRLNEVIAIYPITPSSAMGEWADQWQQEGRKNIWGAVPTVVEMQSEGGAAGALHGALQAGALGTTFTASQGLLLMIPNMYKIAGELTPAVIHVAARTVATHALSIFGDHSDVMATRATGFAMLASNSVQEASDFALIAQAAALESRIPFLHFFDGFRTSHEMNKITPLGDEDLRALVNEKYVLEHRERALSPDRPVLRGTAQNPDVFFQARGGQQSVLSGLPHNRAGRDEPLRRENRQKLSPVRLRRGARRRARHRDDGFRRRRRGRSRRIPAPAKGEGRSPQGPALPAIRGDCLCRRAAENHRPIAVLDRTKEPGSLGEPLYLDVLTALNESRVAEDQRSPRVIGGRYGLSSKEFTPAMAKAVFDEMKKPSPRTILRSEFVTT